jgi:hypothetical protein
MSCVLYYSNICPHCKTLLSTLSRSPVKDDIHFLSIDKRRKKDGELYIILENGSEILLPKKIKKVPSVMLLYKNNQILEGTDVQDHFDLLIETKKPTSNRTIENDPLSFSMGEIAGVVKSDNFSFLDMTADELSAKGNGGTRMMYNYAGLANEDRIETPPDDYSPNKVNEDEIKKYQDERAQIS